MEVHLQIKALKSKWENAWSTDEHCALAPRLYTLWLYAQIRKSLHSLDARLKCGEVALDALEHLSLECALPPPKQQERGEPEHCAHAVEREEAQRGGTLLALNARRALCFWFDAVARQGGGGLTGRARWFVGGHTRSWNDQLLIRQGVGSRRDLSS